MAASLSVMSYNVHAGVGTDGRHDLDRIARVISEADVDVVALQELDVGRKRSEGLNQARAIAERLQMHHFFHPAINLEAEQYGDAILSREPIRLRHAGILPTWKSPLAFEPRGALWVTLDLTGGAVQIINTHLGLSGRERIEQVNALAGPAWLGHDDCKTNTVFCGDLNALPGSPAHRHLAAVMIDSQSHLSRWSWRPTFPSRCPLLRLDYIMVSPDVTFEDVEVIRTPLARVASDHLPVVARLRLHG